MNMTSQELRKKYLEFFSTKGGSASDGEKGHTIIPSASLIPENDPSVLFTTAGMHPLVPYLLGEKHPAGNRLTDVQKCIRTGDIDEVGDSFHHTFFEMLGNWSLGSYFKNEAIEFSFEFLTSKEWLGLDKNRLAVSVFGGDKELGIPRDNEAAEIWKKVGISESRIAYLGMENNWWPAGGKNTGPQGPDTEMFYWTGDPKEIPESFNDDNPKWLEIWNDVFMQYNKTKEGKFEPLMQKNVDTGMGLERTLAVLNGLDDNYKTDLFWPIIQKIEEMSGKKYEGENIRAMRIIADHLKASTFILGDEKGIAPSNTGQGYVLRRLIRRAVRYKKQLGLGFFTKEIAKVVIAMYNEIYPELSKNKEFILSGLEQEEMKFEKTLENGLREFDKIFKNLTDQKNHSEINGEAFFNLYQTFGFPVELSIEEYIRRRQESGLESISEITFQNLTNDVHKKMQEHQELSRTASAGMFRGGLSDAGEETKRLHTATHLLRRALEEVLGQTVTQKGSNITPERLRFDFNLDRKMTEEEKKKVETLVNQKISEKLPVNKIVLTKEEAEKTGATHAFSDKYGNEVSVYYIGEDLDSAWSKEFCGGPHVLNTGDLASVKDPERQSKGSFKILKEEAVSQGIRRIKATLT